MKKNIPLFLILSTIILLAGCLTYTKVSSKQIESLEQNIRSQFQEIRHLKVQYTPSQIQFIYTLKQDLSEKDIEKVFIETKDLIQSQEFLDEVIHHTFFKKYSKEEKRYPPITISFMNHEDQLVIEFLSLYDKPSDNQSLENEIEGYRNWSYRKDENEPYVLWEENNTKEK